MAEEETYKIRREVSVGDFGKAFEQRSFKGFALRLTSANFLYEERENNYGFLLEYQNFSTPQLLEESDVVITLSGETSMSELELLTSDLNPLIVAEIIIGANEPTLIARSLEKELKIQLQ